MSQTFSVEDVAKHTVAEDCWMIIDNGVYDVSKFLPVHPGGRGVLLAYAGKDATDPFFSFHKTEVLEKYVKLCKGSIAGGKSKLSQRQAAPHEDMPSMEYLSQVPFAEPAWIRGGGWTSPYHNDSHKDFRAGVRALLHKDVLPEMAEEDEKAKPPSLEVYQAMGQGGLLSARIGVSCMPMLKHIPGVRLPSGLSPEKFDYFHECIAHEEMGMCGGEPGYIDGLGAGFCIGLPPVLHFGKAAVRDKVVPEVLRGDKRICLAISEPAAGSDVAGITTVCKKSADGSHYIVNGIKKWITNGTFADYFVTAAQGPGKGMSLLLIERSEGLNTRAIKTSYSSAAGTSLVTYDDVKVPAANLLGKENEGFKCVMANFNHERWFICCQLLGSCRLVVKDCMLWCNQRKVFGKKLIEQAVIRNKLARLVASVESCYSWLESLTHQMNTMSYQDQTARLGGPIALLKFQVTRNATLVSDEAVQIFGGRGITKTGMGRNVERFQRTFKFGSILGGSEEIMADLGVRQAFRDMPTHARL